MKVVKIAQTKKNIYIDKDFISYPKSLLTTAMFTIKNRVDELEIVNAEIDGYKSVTLKGKPLNLGIDFTFVGAVLKKLNDTTDDTVSITFNELYKDVDFDNSQPQNNNKAFVKRVDESVERVSSLRIRIEDDMGRIFHGSLFTALIDPIKKKIIVTANGIVRELFELDCNAIFNVDFRIYNQLNKEYAKKLYLFYLTHNMAEENKLPIEMMKDRLLCQNVADRDFNTNVVEANNELIKAGFLVSAVKGYDAGDKRTVKRFIVRVNPKINKKAFKEEEKKEKVKKEVTEHKKEVESKQVVKTKTAASLAFEQDVLKMKDMLKDVKVKEVDNDDPTTWF